MRDPSFVNLQAFADMVRGSYVADFLASLAMLDPILGGIDPLTRAFASRAICFLSRRSSRFRRVTEVTAPTGRQSMGHAKSRSVRSARAGMEVALENLAVLVECPLGHGGIGVECV
jgi:hypothetical protein